MIRANYSDDYTGSVIEDEKDVVELTIKNFGTGETTVSHLHKDSVRGLIEGDSDLESVFIHD